MKGKIDILEELRTKAVWLFKTQDEKIYSQIVSKDVADLIQEIDKNKSLVSVLVTSLLEKICTPTQDIRLHRTDFEGGYSARSLDTNITTPFFKKYFPRYANKETGFLTLATREKIAWTKTEGQSLKIRNKNIKNSFLNILDTIENKTVEPQNILVYIFYKLHILSLEQKQIFEETIETTNYTNILNINTVLSMMEKHFSLRLSSRLPVIAMYSLYELLFPQIDIYKEKILRPLNVHTSSDKHGYGDIEIWNNDNTPYEILEIKHNIPINRNLIFDIAKKSDNTTIQRYYVLTTAKDNFSSKEEENYINKFILKIKKDTGIDIIPNGIYSTMKYYLRFVSDYRYFIHIYTKNLVLDARNSTEVQEFHITEWKNIVQEHSIS